MANRTPQKRPRGDYLGDSAGRVYKFRILLPNGTSTDLTLHEPGKEMSIKDFVELIKKEIKKTGSMALEGKRQIVWDGNVYFEDMSEHEIRKKISFSYFKPDELKILRLHDGNRGTTVFQNMWDLTPDTDLLSELPAEYTFETSLADLIDNSLQAVWHNVPGERRLIRVIVSESRIVVFDSGPGMDGSEENCIVKWGKMGSSSHRSFRHAGIGGKPPYLMPVFGMFGYGGTIASMHLGRHTLVSSKTKGSKKVYTLRIEREALLNKSGSKHGWKTDGGIRDPLEDEMKLSPHGSFTKVEVFEPKLKPSEAFQLQCRLKDIYFPYIQCDEVQSMGQTTMPVEFQVNDVDLAEIAGGEVAITNLESSNGPDFVLQVSCRINQDVTTNIHAGTPRKAHARLKCVYFPIVEGRESIDGILERLELEGCGISENFESFSRVSIRRLGRLLPYARWEMLPFMDLRLKKGEKAQTLKRCCLRVKCFIDTDAGFCPTPSKTDLAHHHPFTIALRNIGCKPLGKDSDVSIEMHKDGKPITPFQLEKAYVDWVMKMHESYDEEIDCGEDQPVLVVNPGNKKGLGISGDVVRVHQVIRRKGVIWKSGQKLKILKGAPGCPKTNMYATLEYILLEGFQGDMGGDARLICRPLECADERGCLLAVNGDRSILDNRDSLSFPISVIDSGKCQAVDDVMWSTQLIKVQQKFPSLITILGADECSRLEIDRALPVDGPIFAGTAPPENIVAVFRPATFTSSWSMSLDQKYIIKDTLEMLFTIEYVNEGKNIENGDTIASETVKPSTHGGLHGLYIFPLRSRFPQLFRRAGIFLFSFSASTEILNCEPSISRVLVHPLEAETWELKPSMLTGRKLVVRTGNVLPCISVVSFDRYHNRTPFLTVPPVCSRIKGVGGRMIACIDKMTVALGSKRMSLEITDAIIESSELDLIRPRYEAKLEICCQEKFSVEISCQVTPGNLHLVSIKDCSTYDDGLAPGAVIELLCLEVIKVKSSKVGRREKPTYVESLTKFCFVEATYFDVFAVFCWIEKMKSEKEYEVKEIDLASDNRSQGCKGVEVDLDLDGLGFLQPGGSRQKVNDHGYVNLSGLLKVESCYGTKAYLSVLSDGKCFLKKEFDVQKRKLRVASRVPNSCYAGSQLENIVFEIVDFNGVVDGAIHGPLHCLSITSDLQVMNETVQYIFQQGRCTIPVIAVPLGQEKFCFRASHSRHPELQINIEILVVQTPELEMVAVSEPGSVVGYTPLTEERGLQALGTSLWTPEETNPLFSFILNDQMELEKAFEEAKTCVDSCRFRLTSLNYQKEDIEKELFNLQASMSSESSCHFDDLMNSRDKIVHQVKAMVGTPAVDFCDLPRSISFRQADENFKQDIVGIVALLGTVNCSRLSKTLADYLGQEYMLGIVCKSYEVANIIQDFGEKKIVDFRVSHLDPSLLRMSNHCLVICLEEIRPFTGGFKRRGGERSLALPDPVLPSGRAPEGFLGFAVNLIDIDVGQSKRQTKSGHGLRETLFYRLFRDLQVYRTREDMKRAGVCITSGAVSIDGGNFKGNGIIAFSSREPSIMFPVVNSTVRKYFLKNSCEELNALTSKLDNLEALRDSIKDEETALARAERKLALDRKPVLRRDSPIQ
ncbi:hypothetical protein H6P81_014368 [Aristolochia fimbriata]|uniref:Uncharacterized protein n=1 Tax=Aristolochia fimbriata TaxID=158543 RepID=A0AAV7EJG2_ARIFI|nr:hypothetical protein H6P81_014368 [Aristolochia fimbriata]